MPYVRFKRDVGSRFKKGAEHYLTKPALSHLAKAEGVKNWQDFCEITAAGAAAQQKELEMRGSRPLRRRQVTAK